MSRVRWAIEMQKSFEKFQSKQFPKIRFTPGKLIHGLIFSAGFKLLLEHPITQSAGHSGLPNVQLRRDRPRFVWRVKSHSQSTSVPSTCQKSAVRVWPSATWLLPSLGRLEDPPQKGIEKEKWNADKPHRDPGNSSHRDSSWVPATSQWL